MAGLMFRYTENWGSRKMRSRERRSRMLLRFKKIKAKSSENSLFMVI